MVFFLLDFMLVYRTCPDKTEKLEIRIEEVKLQSTTCAEKTSIFWDVSQERKLLKFDHICIH